VECVCRLGEKRYLAPVAPLRADPDLERVQADGGAVLAQRPEREARWVRHANPTRGSA